MLHKCCLRSRRAHCQRLQKILPMRKDMKMRLHGSFGIQTTGRRLNELRIWLIREKLASILKMQCAAERIKSLTFSQDFWLHECIIIHRPARKAKAGLELLPVQKARTAQRSS